MPARIAYYSSSTLPSRAANSVHVMKMCAALAAEGAEVLLFGRRGRSAGVTELFRLYAVRRTFRTLRFPQIPVRGWNHCRALLVAWQARRWRPDIHHGRCLHSIYYAARLGHAVSFEAHQPCAGPGSNQRKLFEEILRRDALRLLVVNTESLRDWYCREFRLSPGRVLVLCNGAELPDPEPPPWQRDPVRRLRVGYVGQLYVGRGMGTIARLAQTLPRFDFEVVGGCESDLARWRRELAPLPNLVLRGFVPCAETVAFHRRCDVLIAPYERKVTVAGGAETTPWASPIKLFEYMASRRPIVCSDLPVLREVLRDGENSFLCEPENVSAWVAALARIDSDPALARRLAENAYHEFKHHYTWRHRAQKLLAALTGAGGDNACARAPDTTAVPVASTRTPTASRRRHAA